MQKWLRWSVLAFGLCTVGDFSVAANPYIERVAPPVGQAGTQFAILIVGDGLETCQDLVFYSPGIKCQRIEPVSEYELRVTLQAGENCELGNQPFRLLSEHGFSNLRTLRITPFPVVMNDQEEQPLECQYADTTVYGNLERGAIDRVRVPLRKGQRLSLEVEAMRLGYELLDTQLSVQDPTGQIVLAVDDTPLYQQDPAGAIVAALDGDYTISVHECNYDGGENSHYLLHLGGFPEPAVAYPAGGQLNDSLEIHFINRHGDSRAQQATLTGDPESFQLFGTLEGHRAPSPTPFRVSRFPNVLEKEPNDTSREAEVATVPVAFNGILTQPGDVDVFGFAAEAGKRYRIESFADRIGSPIDSWLELRDQDGKVLATNDDWGSHDSCIEWVADCRASVTVRVTDKLGKGAVDAVYRIEVTESKPSLTTFLPRPDRLSQQGQTISVPQGNRVMKRVAVRRDLAEGPVSMQFQGLPRGVHSSPVSVPEDQFWVPAVIEADSVAPIGGQLSGLEASLDALPKALRGDFEQAVDLVASTADQLYHSVHVDRVPVAVTAPVPFKVDLEPPTTSLPRGGTLELVVSVEREEGFTAPVRVELPLLPPWVVAEPFIVIPSDATRGSFQLEARAQAQPRSWSIVATAKVDALSAEQDVSAWQDREVASRLCPLAIEPAPVAGRLPVLAGVQGEKLIAVCGFAPGAKLPDDATAQLEGLPNRIEASLQKLTSETAVFEVTIAEDAPLGDFEQIQCRLTGTLGEQAVSYVVAPESRLIVAEPGKLKKAEDGSLLSPLEALRARD